MKKKIYYIFLILLLTTTIYCMVHNALLEKRLLAYHDKSEALADSLVLLRLENTSLKEDVETLKENQSLHITAQSDNPTLLSALSTMTNLARFIPDFVPLQSSYAVSKEFNSNHQSIDLSASKGTKIFSAGAGIVIACYEDKNLGNVILIDHLNSYKTLYAHLDQFRVSVNTFVEKGQEVGSVGNTGNSTNPHLHFQIYFGNDPVEPNSIMKIAKYKN
ncbi:MAG: M23 family metallopeptidase [Candidatus Cloacimonetes bacterium]|nr:M23 family metallopeptidase [Candidatus Cloacimonadota bacterium]